MNPPLPPPPPLLSHPTLLTWTRRRETWYDTRLRHRRVNHDVMASHDVTLTCDGVRDGEADGVIWSIFTHAVQGDDSRSCDKSGIYVIMSVTSEQI